MEENESIISYNDRVYEQIKYLKKQWFYKTIIIFTLFGCAIGIAVSSITYYLTIKEKNDKFVASTYTAKQVDITNATNAVPEVSQVLTDFAELIDDKYIGEIEKTKLIDETVKGFVKGIGDEYSEYMTKEDWDKFQEEAMGNYSGVGIIMTSGDNGYILVTKVVKDSPAEKAGVLQGDYIVGVNGESIYEESTNDVASKVRGETGTDVTINVSREGEDELLEFNLTRQKVRVYHVEGKMFENNIGYLYFNTFDEGCADEFEKEMDSLVEQGATKLIIDLRYNTGGDVSETLKILDMFLEKGQIEIITKSSSGPEIATSSKTDRKYNLENIVILTNGYTASASEILTGALVENGLAKTVGTKTYGKGVMQTLFPLKDGSILKLTTQEYNTPKGTKINKIGISPDYEIEYEKNGQEDNQLEKAKAVLNGEE